MPDMSGKKTLGRRLSFKRAKPKRFFYVLDAKLLTWYQEPKGKELGFIHLGKVSSIDHDAHGISFTVHMKDGTRKDFSVESVDPNVTSHDMCADWVEALQSAIAHRPSSGVASRQTSVSGRGNGTEAVPPSTSSTLGGVRESDVPAQPNATSAPASLPITSKNTASPNEAVIPGHPVSNPTSQTAAEMARHEAQTSPKQQQQEEEEEEEEEEFGF